MLGNVPWFIIYPLKRKKKDLTCMNMLNGGVLLKIIDSMEVARVNFL